MRKIVFNCLFAGRAAVLFARPKTADCTVGRALQIGKRAAKNMVGPR